MAIHVLTSASAAVPFPDKDRRSPRRTPRRPAATTLFSTAGVRVERKDKERGGDQYGFDSVACDAKGGGPEYYLSTRELIQPCYHHRRAGLTNAGANAEHHFDGNGAVQCTVVVRLQRTNPEKEVAKLKTGGGVVRG